jgi:hypothetical protein
MGFGISKKMVCTYREIDTGEDFCLIYYGSCPTGSGRGFLVKEEEDRGLGCGGGGWL